jgi:hypothetical protein
VFRDVLCRVNGQIQTPGNANLQIGALKDAIQENGAPGNIRKTVKLMLFRNESNADFYDGSFFKVKRLGRNQNAVAIARPDFARRVG